MQKAHCVADYIYGSKERHCLILAPKSKKMVASADAAYAEHANGKSHSGGTVGFESDTACSFAFVSSKAIKSTGEGELIAKNKMAVTIEWAREALDVLGYPQGKVVLNLFLFAILIGVRVIKLSSNININFSFHLNERIAHAKDDARLQLQREQVS